MAVEGSFQVKCACGKKLMASPGSVGKKARCPKCGATLIVKADESAKTPMVAQAVRSSSSAPKAAVSATPRSRPAPIGIPIDDDPFSALNELAAQADSAPPLPDAMRCPHCASPMGAAAVLCVNCGFDSRTGKKLAATSVAPASSAPQPAKRKVGNKQTDYMAPTGSFAAGLLISAFFAVAASVLWFLVAWASGLAIGYIAILIGGAAGVGMQIGQKGYSTVGGFTAAGMTCGAILLAKVAVVQVILSSHHSVHKSVFDLDSTILAAYFLSPMSLIIMAIGMAAAYRTASGSIKG